MHFSSGRQVLNFSGIHWQFKAVGWSGPLGNLLIALCCYRPQVPEKVQEADDAQNQMDRT